MRLKEIREAKGLSQRKVALDLNLSPVVYGRYENGLREPSNAMLPILADYFGVTIDELLGRDRGDPNSIPHTIEARILASGIDQMPKEERERAIDAMKLIFTKYASYFERTDNDNDDNTEL